MITIAIRDGKCIGVDVEWPGTDVSDQLKYFAEEMGECAMIRVPLSENEGLLLQFITAAGRAFDATDAYAPMIGLLVKVAKAATGAPYSV